MLWCGYEERWKFDATTSPGISSNFPAALCHTSSHFHTLQCFLCIWREFSPIYSLVLCLWRKIISINQLFTEIANSFRLCFKRERSKLLSLYLVIPIFLISILIFQGERGLVTATHLGFSTLVSATSSPNARASRQVVTKQVYILNYNSDMTSFVFWISGEVIDVMNCPKDGSAICRGFDGSEVRLLHTSFIIFLDDCDQSPNFDFFFTDWTVCFERKKLCWRDVIAMF